MRRRTSRRILAVEMEYATKDDGTSALVWAALFGLAAAAAFAWGRVGMAGVFVLVLLCARMLGVALVRRRRQRAARKAAAP